VQIVLTPPEFDLQQHLVNNRLLRLLPPILLLKGGLKFLRNDEMREGKFCPCPVPCSFFCFNNSEICIRQIWQAFIIQFGQFQTFSAYTLNFWETIFLEDLDCPLITLFSLFPQIILQKNGNYKWFLCE
jgi:hypothetical protein